MTRAGSTPATPAAGEPRRSGGDPRLTPAMQQHARFKRQHPGCLLLFRMGDFYELFDEDAVVASRALGITLTQRTAGVPMAGVPFHSVEGYLARLIAQGHRVAVCDQIQDPREARGVVDRAVTRVLTPGTLVDESLLQEGRCNLVAVVFPAEGPPETQVTIATAELSTGAFTLSVVPLARLSDELQRLDPAELLFASGADGAPPPAIERARAAIGCALTPRPDWSFRPAEARAVLLEHYQVARLDGFGLAGEDPSIPAAGALLRYLRETQAGDGAARLGHLRPPRPQRGEDNVVIDAASLRSLEIERTMRSGEVEGSLISVLQPCASAMGRRLLRHWLCFPLRDIGAIEARQEVVAALLADPATAEALRHTIGGVQDVARIMGRVCTGRATPRDLAGLGASLGAIEALAELLGPVPALGRLADRLAGLSGPLLELSGVIGRACVDDPPAHAREGGVFRPGYDRELDELRAVTREASAWLAGYQARLIQETGIASLKVGFNKIFGYYIEVTHAQAAKVPAGFARRQTLKNAERYTTEELRAFEEKVTGAEERAIEREKRLLSELCERIAGAVDPIAAFADVVAEIDVLWSFAAQAARSRSCRPRLIDEPGLRIVEGRHPVLDRLLRDAFVPNDCLLGPCGPDDARSEGEAQAGDGAATRDGPAPTLAIITGPNMAGKSTYIRQVAIIVLLAHCGAFVPAESATIGLVDRIFTRIGAADELHAGQSTFMVEMTETANILHHATRRSLVVLDEIGRGTGTLDGLSLAWAIAETIAARGCRTLFATHYHELTRLAERLEGVANLHVAVREWGEQVIFLHRIRPGGTDRSYGLHVARIAGVPRATVDRAGAVLETLAVHTGPEPGPSARPGAGDQLRLFTEYLEHPALDALRRLEIDRMSPLEAFDALRGLIEQASR